MVSYKSLEFIDILKKEGLPVVDISLLKKLTGLKNSQSLASFIKSLEKAGVLEKAERSKYLVTSNLGNDFLIANLLYKPSYVSLATALNVCGMLSQMPVEITSITTKRKKEKKVNGKLFVYHKISKKLFWGFEKKGRALIAVPEKALLDNFYFKTKGIRGIEIDDLDLTIIKKGLFKDYTGKFPQTKKFKKLVNKTLGKIK